MSESFKYDLNGRIKDVQARADSGERVEYVCTSAPVQ